ncbi:DUF3604 domain-containing protein [Phyllobacterium sp. 1468]|uniref:DUF3604 domain-containing protein n=1 Tax=Phyllobacterium sp. 1468 TaxID=2817759 RepID=UPI00286C1B40|nr:DUF3604 domain-containing protein [Phyllobacterium sp. 1468]
MRPQVPGSYVRQALKDGISMQDTRGYNPYKMGFVGGSDSHNTGVPCGQDRGRRYDGGSGAPARPRRRSGNTSAI